MAVISSVGDCCFVSTPLVSFEVEYESCFVVAQPEKTQVLAVTRKHSKNARIFFIAWSWGLTTKAEPQPRQPGFTWNDDIQSRDHGQNWRGSGCWLQRFVRPHKILKHHFVSAWRFASNSLRAATIPIRNTVSAATNPRILI